MAWQTPKTNWKVTYDANGNYIGDYFNAEDYQRIKGNLFELRDMVEDLNNTTITMTIPDVTVLSSFYETTINALERAIDALADGILMSDMFTTKTWAGNDAAPLAADLNRIEGVCLHLYQYVPLIDAARPRLAFILGGVQF